MRWFDPKQLEVVGRVGAVGAELVAAILLGWLGGRWLDGWLGTGWIQWLGLVLGLAAGFLSLSRLARRLRRELDAPSDEPPS